MLGIAGIVIMIVLIYQTYKTARDNGRNGGLWGAIAFVVGFGIQQFIPFVVGMVLGFVWAVQGSSMAEIRSRIVGPATIAGIVCLVLSIISVWLILKKVSQIPDEPILNGPPPPPAEFQ